MLQHLVATKLSEVFKKWRKELLSSLASARHHISADDFYEIQCGASR
ncbi:MAG: hypothetical protein ACTS73_01680 [Arsenophonus sp. NEOnobi-MAG3]